MCNFNDGGEGCVLVGKSNPNYGKNMSGKNNPMFGKHHTEETKKKISDANKGKFAGENNPMYGNGDKIKGENNPMYGKQHTEETKRKMKENHANIDGENNPMYGRRHSDETKRKRGKSVICITTKKIFHISKEGAEYYNCDNSGIIKCCKGKYKSTGKHNGIPLVWRYITWNHNKKYRIKK